MLLEDPGVPGAEVIAEVDFSQLEWRVAAELSKCPVMIQEILDGVDVHESVRSDPKLFNGKVDRVWAKVFNFRAIFMDENTGAFAFYTDPNMPKLAKRTWDGIVTAFLAKYHGLYNWHQRLYRDVMINQGKLVMPNGKIYSFRKYPRGGTMEYKRAQIYNYPVQGTAGGELLPLALISLRRTFLNSPIKIVNTVHDSIIFDLPGKKELDFLAETWYNVLRMIPERYTQFFGVSWTVPLDGEIKYGPSWGEMETLKCK